MSPLHPPRKIWPEPSETLDPAPEGNIVKHHHGRPIVGSPNRYPLSLFQEFLPTSINEFGFKIPILACSSGEVVDGHLRLKAAQKLGLSEVPVILCDEWADAQVKAFRLLVNRSVTWADWDEELLAIEFAELKTLDFDLSLTGFDPVEIDDFLFAKRKKRGCGPGSRVATKR